MQILRLFSGSVTLIAGLTLATGSRATDRVTEHGPGQDCIKRDANSSRPNYYGTLARNDTASVAPFYCPIHVVSSLIVQDSDTEATLLVAGLDYLSVIVTVADSSSASNLECYLKVCDTDETNCVTSDTEASTVSDGSVEQLALRVSGVNLSIGANQVAFVKCDVPAINGAAMSGIVSYLAEVSSSSM